MTTQELLQIFSQFTREDWQQMETIKNIAFQPTQAEIDLQTQEQELARINAINSKLANLWITRPKIITKEIVLLLLTQIKAEQFIWADFEWWIENQIILFWDLETAFNELVLTYL